MISIIIPTYNSSQTVCASIDSVLESSIQKLEIIVVDDGSNDDTKTKISSYIKDQQIRYIFQNNKGLAGARNTGIKEAEGEFLVFLDADDVILPGKLEVQKKYLLDNTDVDIVYSHSQWFIEDDLDNTRPVNFPVHRGEVTKELIYGNFMHVNSIMVRRSKVIEVELFDEELRELEDWDLWLRMVLSGSKVGFTPGIYSKVRIRTGSMTSDQQRMNLTMIKVLQKTIVSLEGTNRKDLLLHTYNSLSIYKLKARQTKGYFQFLMNTCRHLGYNFYPLALKQGAKYFARPLLKQNKTTKQLEQIWKN